MKVVNQKIINYSVGTNEYEERSVFTVEDSTGNTIDMTEKLIKHTYKRDSNFSLQGVEFVCNGHLDTVIDNKDKSIGILRTFGEYSGFRHLRDIDISKFKTLKHKMEMFCSNPELLGARKILSAADYIFDDINLSEIIDINKLGLYIDVKIGEAFYDSGLIHYKLNYSIRVKNKSLLCGFNTSDDLNRVVSESYWSLNNSIAGLGFTIEDGWKLGYNKDNRMFTLVNEFTLFEDSPLDIKRFISVCIDV